jgi:hypothetical protein
MRSGGRLPLSAVLRCRVRYFTDGVALGSEEFLERFFQSKREVGLFGTRRRTGARNMRYAQWGEMRTMRDLTEAVRLPSDFD